MPLGTSADYEAKLPLFFRSCGRFSPKLWKNATFARDTGDVCSRIVPYLMPCCLISHVLFHPISCIILTYLMPCCLISHALFHPISCIILTYPMSCCLISHALFHPISCIVLTYPMPCCLISHVLFHPISCIVFTYPMPCCLFFFCSGATHSVPNLE